MRRAVLTLGSTAAGLAALLMFKTHPDAGAAATSPAGTAGTAGMASTLSPSTALAVPAPSASPSARKKASMGTGAPAATRTVTGAAASTQYGPMQVQLTLTRQEITKVTVLQQTDDGTLSAQIDSRAIPKLTAETLTAQSARIDAVSGATYTSSGYIQSLQSALDRASA